MKRLYITVEDIEEGIEDQEFSVIVYEKGINVLKHNGIISFITSNKWMRAGYGEKLREFFELNALKEFKGR